MPTSSPVEFDAIARAVAGCACISAAWVFGSLARGDATPSSDLDLAVVLRRPGGPADEAALRELSLDLERFSPSGGVDIVVLGAQGSVFRHHVLRDGRLVLDRDPAARRAFEGQAFADYLDWKPTHDIAMASTMSGLRRRLGGAR